MSLMQLSTSLICITILIFCFVKKTKLKNKPWINISFRVFLIFFSVISFAIFIRQHFIPYSSPEDAYKYVYGGKTFLVVEGIESDYVIGNKDAKYLKKSEKGWKVPIMHISITKGIKRIGSTTIYVSQFNFSDEYYVTVLNSEKSNLELKDNRNSIFYKSNSNENVSNVESCVYYTYVNKINNEYVISVNGEKIKLFE